MDVLKSFLVATGIFAVVIFGLIGVMVALTVYPIPALSIVGVAVLICFTAVVHDYRHGN